MTTNGLETNFFSRTLSSRSPEYIDDFTCRQKTSSKIQSFGFFYKKGEVQSFNKMHPVFSYSEKNPSNSQKNPENSKNYVIKKSKENISRRSSKGEERNFAVFCVKDNRRQKVPPKLMEQSSNVF